MNQNLNTDIINEIMDLREELEDMIEKNEKNDEKINQLLNAQLIKSLYLQIIQ